MQGTSVLSPLGPIGLLIGLAITIWMKSPTDVFQNNIVLYVVSFGMASSKITNKLVVSLAVINECFITSCKELYTLLLTVLSLSDR